METLCRLHDHRTYAAIVGAFVGSYLTSRQFSKQHEEDEFDDSDKILVPVMSTFGGVLGGMVGFIYLESTCIAIPISLGYFANKYLG